MKSSTLVPWESLYKNARRDNWIKMKQEICKRKKKFEKWCAMSMRGWGGRMFLIYQSQNDVKWQIHTRQKNSTEKNKIIFVLSISKCLRNKYPEGTNIDQSVDLKEQKLGFIGRRGKSIVKCSHQFGLLGTCTSVSRFRRHIRTLDSTCFSHNRQNFRRNFSRSIR